MRQAQIEIGNVPAENYNDFFQKVNRILSGIQVTNSMRDMNGTVAYCDLKTKDIVIDYSQVSKSVVKAVTQLRGLNYHELAHLMYTVQSRYITGNIALYHNILEDGKIETLFSTNYPKSAKYFRASTVKFILNSKNISAPENYLLVYNRRGFLPTEMVSYCKQAFTKKYGKIVLAKATKIMDKYMVAHKVTEQAKLTTALWKLMEQNHKPQPPRDYILRAGRLTHPEQNTNATTMGGNTQTQKADMEQAAKQLKQQDKQATQQPNLPEGKDLTNKGASAGTGNKTVKVSKDKMEKAAKQTIKTDSPDLRQEAEMDIKAVQQTKQGAGGFNAGDVSGSLGVGWEAFTPDEDRKVNQMSYKLAKLLKAIQGNRQGSINRHKLSGKVDMRSALVAQANGGMRIFSKDTSYTKKKVLVACTILVDESGSVNDWQHKQEIMAAKAIAQAIKKSGGECQVYAFSSQFEIKKRFKGSANWERQMSGGTRPTPAIKKALKVQLSYARRKGIANNLIIVLTDGEYGLATAKRIKGVTYAEFLIGKTRQMSGYYQSSKEAFYDTLEVVPKFNDLLEAMGKFLVKYQKQIKRRVA